MMQVRPYVRPVLIGGLALCATVAECLTVLKRHWIASDLAYGVVIYLVMNFIVVPLSAAPFASTFKYPKSMEDLLAMLLFGLIIAYFGGRRYLS